MLALAYSNDTLDIYDGAVCYMFYRFFRHGVGMVWVRILLPYGFKADQVSGLFKALNMDQKRSFDHWSASTKLSAPEIVRYFQLMGSDSSYWYNKFARKRLIPRYQMRRSLLPVVVCNEPILFNKSTDPVLDRLGRNFLLACLFASKLRDIVIAGSGVGYNVD
jgi:hypothetical protein